MQDKVKKISDTGWEVQLEDDPDHPGELIMQLPEEVINQMGWDFGDELIWNVNEVTHQITLTKKA
jgi:hypothetical protein